VKIKTGQKIKSIFYEKNKNLKTVFCICRCYWYSKNDLEQ